MTNKKFVGFLAALAIGIMALITGAVMNAGSASAATGDMNEVLKIKDTKTVAMIFASNVQEQLAFIDPSLPFDEEEGAFDPAANPEVITVGLNKMEGLRMQSQLAPLVSIAASAVKYVGEHTSIGMFGSKAACITAATAQEFIDQYDIDATQADYVAMRDVLANEFVGIPESTITAAFWQAIEGGHGACGIDTSHI